MLSHADESLTFAAPLNSPESFHATTPLTTGEVIAIAGIGTLRVGEVTERNWSRVAKASGPDGQLYFCKQFIDRVGRAHPRGFAGELATRACMNQRPLAAAERIPLIGQIDQRLIMVFPHVPMTTIDSMRRSSVADLEATRRVGELLAEIVDTQRSPNDPSSVAGWKGLDPKNIGWDETGKMWIFDFGPPTHVDVETTAGRLVAAGLLSRWVARPGTHVVWPERPILRAVCEPLASMTTYDAVDQSLRNHFELRLREPQRTGAAAQATKAGVHTLGRMYWASARQVARSMFAS